MSEQKKPPSIHKNHRARAREGFLANGIDTLSEHRSLELLLFYAIPQRDVNELAHRLLDAFGSLQAVLDAPPEALTAVKGLGAHGASLMAAVRQAMESYKSSRLNTSTQLVGLSAAVAFLRGQLNEGTKEAACVVCLDAGSRVQLCHYLGGDTALFDPACLAVPTVMRLAIESKTTQLLIGRGCTEPVLATSTEEQLAVKRLLTALGSVRIPLRDYILISPDQHMSFFETKLLKFLT